MFKVMTQAMAGLILSTSIVSADAPWEKSKPEGMTDRHQSIANDAARVRSRVGDERFSAQDLDEVDWEIWDGMFSKEPMSNLTPEQLRSLFTGNYFVSFERLKTIVYHFGRDGTLNFCASNGTTLTFKYRFNQSRFGLGGYDEFGFDEDSMTPSGNPGYPVVANPEDGRVGFWLRFTDGKRWTLVEGWVQEEYPAVLAEKCPNIPMKAEINEGQSVFEIKDMARNAKPLRNFNAAFVNEVHDPLTSEMFYWAYPPN